MIIIILLIFICSIHADVVDKNFLLKYGAKSNIEKITRELKEKTGLDIFLIVEKDINFNNIYVEQFLKGKDKNNSLFVFVDNKNNKTYKIEGKNLNKIISSEEIKYILNNEIVESKMKFFSDKVMSTVTIIAKNMADNKNVKLESLRGIFIKPINSIFYKTTSKFPGSIIVKLFYLNPLLFISIFPVVTWIILVKLNEFLFDKKRDELKDVLGYFLWKVLLFVVFCIITIRVGVDYNEYLGSIALTIILFMPFLVIVIAMFKDEIQKYLCKFFGWE